MTSLEREALVRLVRAGDPAALDRLWLDCEAELCDRATQVWRRYAWDPALEVEDAWQEGYLVFRQLVAAWEPGLNVPFEAFMVSWFRRRLSFRLRWLTEQGGHRSLLRTGRVRLVPLEPEAADDDEDEAGHADPAAPDEEPALLARLAFDGATARLLPEDRRLLTLMFVHDLPLTVAARRLGLSRPMATRRLNKTLSALRTSLRRADADTG